MAETDISVHGPNLEDSFFVRLLDMLEQQLGPTTEIVLHDLRRDYAHTIIDIRNGHITGRQVGGTGSNLGLEVLQGTTGYGDKYNYVTRLPNNRMIRSSSMYFKDDGGTVIGSLCINTDITETLFFEKFLHTFNNFEQSAEDVGEVFVSDVSHLLDHLIQRAQQAVERPPEDMTRQDKLAFLAFLDQKGAFLITKSGEKIQDYLGISKYTLYSYLDIIRTEAKRKQAGR